MRVIRYAALLCAILAAGAAVLYSRIHKVAQSARVSTDFNSSASGSGPGVHFRPDVSVEEAARQDVERVWKDLLPSLVADPRSRELIQRIYGPARVELVLLDPKTDIDDEAAKAPPSAGFEVVLRVKVKSSEWYTSLGKRTFGGVFSFRRVTHYTPDPTVAAVVAPGSISSALTDAFHEDLGDTAFYLALEEYSLRCRCGWIALLGYPWVDDEKGPVPGSPEHRAALEQRIREATEKVGGFYTSYGKK